jgi:hypothetical protein
MGPEGRVEINPSQSRRLGKESAAPLIREAIHLARIASFFCSSFQGARVPVAAAPGLDEPDLREESRGTEDLVNTISRVQLIRNETPGNNRSVWRAVRIEVDERSGANVARVTLSPGDRLVIVNRTAGRLTVSPIDFFGSSFGTVRLEPSQASPAMMVTGLWFQVDLHVDDRRTFPLDVYLAPNRAD